MKRPWWAVAGWLVPAIAAAQPDPREAELFGAPPAQTATAAQSSTTSEAIQEALGRDDAVLGDVESPGLDPRTEDVFGGEGGDLVALAEEQADKLALGALLWLRLQYAVVDGEFPETYPLDAPSFLDLYVDGRPTDRVRAYARGRLRYDPTVREGQLNGFGQSEQSVRVQLDQLWVKFDVERALFVTAGKERVKWGAGRFWNPTDFLNQQALDPLAGVTLFDERLGVGLLKLHLPVESLGWNFYAVGTLDEAVAPENLGGALRAEVLIDQAEIALSVAGRKDNPARFGLGLSAGIWELDVKGELALQHGLRQTFIRGSCSPNALLERIERGDVSLEQLQAGSLDAFPELGEVFSRRDDWVVQAVAGAEVAIRYDDQDSVYFGGEYFFNDAGYDDPSLYPCLAARGSFTPFYLGRHYAGLYALLPSPGRWDDTTFVLSGLMNLSDQSGIARIDYRVRVLTYLDVNAFVNLHLGEAGDEFTFASRNRPLVLPAGAPPELADALRSDPRFAVLASGLVIDKPILEVGAGLSLAY